MWKILFLIAQIIILIQAEAFNFNINCTIHGKDKQKCQFGNLTVLTEDETIEKVIRSDTDQSISNIISLNPLQFNNFTFLPLGIGKSFPEIIELSVLNCSVKFIKRDNFKDMEKLKHLQLGANKIETIPEDAFYDLPNLQFLSLCGNQIKTLPEKLLLKSVNINHFRADGNRFEILTNEAFAENLKLEKISIRFGKLKTIKFDFTKLPTIKDISFMRNPCTNATFILNNSSLEDFQKSISETCA